VSSPVIVKVVYDCNVYVQALINPFGPAGECINRALNKSVALFVTDFVLDEIRESYLKIPPKYGVSQVQAEALAAGIASIAAIMGEVPNQFVYERDPDDAHYVNLALAADAKLIVSRDRDLLDLMDDRSIDGVDFKRRFPVLRILDPVSFLKELNTSVE
jgi:putative PIN family toxin of toxin-antitoxin system